MEEIFIGLHDAASSPYFNNRTYNRTIDLAGQVIQLPNTLDSQARSNSYYFNCKNVQSIFDNVDVLGNIFFVESNSAHHISYYLAKKAFAGCSQDTKKAVLNIDQHEDSGNCPSIDKMFCGNWGSAIKKDADYFVEGKVRPNQSGNTILTFQSLNGNGINHKVISQELTGSNKYVYVSVDMDVLDVPKSDYKFIYRTNWKNGGMTLEELKNTLRNDLNGVNVIAADITGFPLKTIDSSAAQQYLLDIEAVAQVLKGLIHTPVTA